MKREDVLKVQIWAKGWVDTPNGNPYHAYLVKIKTAHYAENIYIECDGDYGSCGKDSILMNWVFHAIERWFGLKYVMADVKSGVVEYHYKKVYRKSELENPRKWRVGEWL